MLHACNIHFSYMCTYTMASACIDVHVRPIHVNIHIYTRLMHVHVRICKCTCMSHIHVHVYVHAPPMHKYCTHTRVYIHVHAPQHVHACPIHVYMQLDYSLSVGKALPEISIACTSTTVSPPVCLTAAQHKVRSLLRLLYHCRMYIHACTASFVARQYLCAQNYGMTFDHWNILSHGT